MTVRDALREGAAALAGSETPFLDASLLLAAALRKDKSGLLASGPEELGSSDASAFGLLIAERARGVPVAYILGLKEFWGREFRVDRRVLVPRPDTEALVEAALRLGDAILREREERAREGFTAESAEGAERRRGEAVGDKTKNVQEDSTIDRESLAKASDIDSISSSHLPLRDLRALRGEPPGGPPRLRVHDACTGSGCIAVSVAAERPEWIVSASDVSTDALDVARANAEALLDPRRPGGAVEFTASDLLEGVGGEFDLIVSNPPYVESAEAARLLGLGWSEPRSALDGGEDGLDLVRRLVPRAAAALSPGGALAVEADPAQSPAVAELFRASRLAGVAAVADLAGRPRATTGRKPWKA